MDGMSVSQREPSPRSFPDSSKALWGKRGPGREQSRASCPRNGSRGARSTQSSTSSAHRPSPRWAGGAVSAVGSQREESARLCFQERAARSPPRCFSLCPGVCVQQEASRAAVTALRRGPAPRAGPRRGPRWHTTGADLEGSTWGQLCQGPTLPRTVTGQVRQDLGTEWASGGKETPQSAWAWHSAAAVPGLSVPQKPTSKKYWLCVSVS